MKEIEGIKLYEVPDLVKILDLSRLTIQGYLRAGKIKGVKVGKQWCITEENLRDFLSGNTIPRKK